MSITNEQIEQLRDHDKAMAPVPWEAKCEGERHLYLVAENGEHRHVAIGMKSMGIRFEDFRGIAATRNAMPDMLEELTRLRAALDEGEEIKRLATALLDSLEVSGTRGVYDQMICPWYRFNKGDYDALRALLPPAAQPTE